MPKVTRPDDGRLKANRERTRFLQRAVYMPWMQVRLCTPDEVAKLYASDRPAAPSVKAPGLSAARPRRPDAERDWSNTPVEQWHQLPDSVLLHFLFVGCSTEDRKAGRAPLEYSLPTQVVRILRARAEERERG